MYETTFESTERATLRRLAAEVAELAAHPREAESALWYRHNDLVPTRPLVVCDPENGWNEILPQAELECRAEQARFWEMALRREIFWGTQLLDDRVDPSVFRRASCLRGERVGSGAPIRGSGARWGLPWTRL